MINNRATLSIFASTKVHVQYLGLISRYKRESRHLVLLNTFWEEVGNWQS